MTTETTPTAQRARLVAVDMDGTFLDSTGNYQRERFAALHARFQRHGVRFVVASGNQYWALRRYFTDYPDVTYIAENGGLIGTTDRILHTSPFAPSDAVAAIALVGRMPSVFTLVCTPVAAYALRASNARRIAALGRYYARTEIVDSFDEVREPILKLALSCPRDATEALHDQLSKALEPGCVPTSSGHGSIDIVPAGVNKGAALTWLGRQLSIHANEMIAFGDGGNDLEMLTHVGIGVAMANAPDRVKDAATHTTVSNDEAGVLAWLEGHQRLWLSPNSRDLPSSNRQDVS